MSQLPEELQLSFASWGHVESHAATGSQPVLVPPLVELLTGTVRKNGPFGDVKMLLGFVHVLNYQTSSV